jgi:hypothetical protein
MQAFILAIIAISFLAYMGMIVVAMVSGSDAVSKAATRRPF